jgi:phage terminase large subunit-like protein
MDDVLTGKIPACKYVRQACLRQRRDLERFGEDHPLFYFDEELAGRACRFIELLPHIEGPAAFYHPDGSPNCIKLEGWQCFVVTCIFGWRRKDTGGRRFRIVYVEVPRGNGKSALSSAIALYGLCADDEEGAQVYSAATTREQAGIVFGVSKAMMRKKRSFAAKMGVIVNDHIILHPRTNSRFIPLSREAKSLDGKNVHLSVIDELHAHTTPDVYNVLVTALAKRLASMLFIITTAGTDVSGICYTQRVYTGKVLEGTVQDDTRFGIIYTLDEEDLQDNGWMNPAVWPKANPNWGISVMPDMFGALASVAMSDLSQQANFLTKHLNIWCNAAHAWMDMVAWNRMADPALNEVDFERCDEEQRPGELCFGGLDLMSKIDLAAFGRVYCRDLPARDPACLKCGLSSADHPPSVSAPPLGDGEPPPCSDFEPDPKPERHYYAFVTHYLPEQALRASGNNSYPAWEQQGLIRTTPGEVMDFGIVKEDVLARQKLSQQREVAFDPYQAVQLSQELMAKGVVMVELQANVKNYSAPMKEILALVKSGRFHHNGCPVLAWEASNVVCETDRKENVYPRKEVPQNKIDGIISLIQAMNRAMLAVEDVSPYAGGRGFLEL